MSEAIAPLTKLEAVNQMLRDIGERETNSLSSPSRSDVIKAIAALEHVSRGVQLQGFWFNTELIEVTVNGSGQYAIPSTAARVEISSGGPTSGTRGAPKLVVRGRVLYDTVNATDVFALTDPSVELYIVRLLEFTDLPATARDYVYAAASIRFQSQVLGSASVDSDLQQQARLLRAVLGNEDVKHNPEVPTYAARFVDMMHRR